MSESFEKSPELEPIIKNSAGELFQNPVENSNNFNDNIDKMDDIIEEIPLNSKINQLEEIKEKEIKTEINNNTIIG